jgi:diacylglycerol kinase family enzyme
MLHLFVINPRSFPDKNVMAELIVTITKYFGENADIYISKYPRDAVAKVNDYLEKAVEKDEIVRVYAVGGDGILFDCLNGMEKYKDHELTNVPYGNANDFLRAFGDENVERFRNIKYLSKSPTVLTDTISCGKKTALTGAGIGLECTAVVEMEKMSHNLAKVPFLRKLIPSLYVLGAIAVLSNREMRSQNYDIKLDGIDYSGEYIIVNVSNSCANGGKNVPSPYATPDDGWIDAVFVRKMSFIKSLFAVSKYTRGEFEKWPKYFFHVRCKEVTVASDKPIRICLDGESFYASNLDIKVNPGALKFVAPPEVFYQPRKKYVEEEGI